MKYRFFFIGCAFVLLTGLLVHSTKNAHAGGNVLVIIANKHFGGDKVSKADVKHVFQKDVERLAGGKAMPIHAKKTSPLRKAFNQKVLGMSVSKEETYWQQKKVKSGKLPPKELANTVSAVSMVRGSIGYAFESDIKGKEDKVKVLLKL